MSDETTDLLKEMLKWQKLQGMNTLRKIIPEILSDEKRKQAYELTDGKNSREEITKKTGVAGGTVSNWWNLWYSYGIVTKKGQKYQRIVSLKDLAISMKEKGKKEEEYA